MDENLTPLHILHISSAKTWRGGEQQLAYLVQTLQAQSVTQTVLCVKDSAMSNFCVKHQIPFKTYKKRFSINPLVGKMIAKICQTHRINLIHTHDAHAHTFAYLSAQIYNNTTPIVVSRRVDFPIKNTWFSKQKYNHPSIHKIVCVSDAVRQIAAPSITDTSKLVVVHDGIKIERFSIPPSGILRKEYQLSPTTKIVGNVAAIAPHKDYFTFVNTVSEVVKQRQDVHFFIIGADGGEQAAIEQYIQEKQLQKHISLTGFRNDIPHILPELDLFMITSKTEGLGTSILDAMACKVPVLATAAGGISEIVLHQQTGLLADIKDARQLAQHLSCLLDDSPLRKQLVQNATQHLQQFTHTQMGLNTLKVYKRLV